MVGMRKLPWEDVQSRRVKDVGSQRGPIVSSCGATRDTDVGVKEWSRTGYWWALECSSVKCVLGASVRSRFCRRYAPHPARFRKRVPGCERRDFVTICLGNAL